MIEIKDNQAGKYGVDGMSDEMVESILSGEPYMQVLTPRQKIQLNRVDLSKVGAREI